MNNDPTDTQDEETASMDFGNVPRKKNEIPMPDPTVDHQETILSITQHFTKTLEALTKSFSEINQTRTITPPKIEFSGLDHENPTWFLEQFEKYFKEANVEEDSEKIRLIESHLRGEARKWQEPYRITRETYANFRSRFNRYFNASSRVATLAAKLYGEKQPFQENATNFIIRKRSLFNRISPEVTEEYMTWVILDQLRPELRSRLRTKNYADIEDLVQTAQQVETDLKEAERSNWKTGDRNEKFDVRKPVQEIKTPSAGQQREKTSRPYVPCRYCGEWHFHNQCSKNPYRQTAPITRPAEPPKNPEIRRIDAQPTNHPNNEPAENPQ